MRTSRAVAEAGVGLSGALISFSLCWGLAERIDENFDAQGVGVTWQDSLLGCVLLLATLFFALLACRGFKYLEDRYLESGDSTDDNPP